MIIKDFTCSHIDEATTLAKANYEEERQFVSALPQVDSLPDLTSFADNDLGVAAFENGKMLGFLSCYRPMENAFGTTRVKGTFSPCHAHGAVQERRGLIFSRLYQSAAAKWVKKEILSHAIGLYAHDAQAIKSFFVNSFGLRCIDAIRPMEEIKCSALSEFTFCELDRNRQTDILSLNNWLISHLSRSPIFMPFPQLDKQTLQDKFNRKKSRCFAACKAEEKIAYIKIDDSGETFVSGDSGMKNICGAFCLPEYRGMGVSQNLLNFLITTLKAEGYTRLGVDFESFNPTAYGFWLKYFNAYTNSLVRRIDELAIENNNSTLVKMGGKTF